MKIITKFKFFEKCNNDIKHYYESNINNDKLLCIDNRIGELEDTMDFTVGKKYDVKQQGSIYTIIIDEYGEYNYFYSSDLFKNFSNDDSYDDYLIRKDAEKYNL